MPLEIQIAKDQLTSVMWPQSSNLGEERFHDLLLCMEAIAVNSGMPSLEVETHTESERKKRSQMRWRQQALFNVWRSFTSSPPGIFGYIIEMEAGVGDFLGLYFEAGAFLDFSFMSEDGPRSERVKSNRRRIRRR
ncbi:hypothetical protein F2Q70_00015305 [Brassica cretica]|uniref:Uncharacterized protein n=1 Tax=Brassica cretica TaxID=69181 RepID=A0A8S9I086_BRACR|nr:hypothetical protein F2Q70_00015305 [Brassica cretica]